MLKGFIVIYDCFFFNQKDSVHIYIISSFFNYHETTPVTFLVIILLLREKMNKIILFPTVLFFETIAVNLFWCILPVTIYN